MHIVTFVVQCLNCLLCSFDRPWRIKIELRSWDQAMIDLSSIGAIVVFRFISFLSGRNKDNAIASVLPGCRGQLSGRDGLLICGTRGRHRNAFSRRRKRENAIQRVRLWSIDSQRYTGYPAFRLDSVVNASSMCRCSNRSSRINNFFVQTLISYSVKSYLFNQQKIIWKRIQRAQTLNPSP